ncbi:replication initiation factor domain-containing protein [Effusibacillus dendaii]|uniref:Uncharacterized protein n=1 Tax=Effusibacillus dendaii TaxID=2743772 RepID=A0A7I8DIL1_9BACL|nr:replication initiation factor domain-containing protein [Effusibacillus dendaii]BCJ87681.1 hypothetical protein skT53_26660 [Effusibacillus dendaii]
MKAKVSIDKFVMEYTDVPLSAYYALVGKAVKSGELYKQYFYCEGYSYQLHLKKADGAYLHVFYRNWIEPEGMSYTLRLETRPEYYFHFKELLDALRRVASGIYFVSCDIAYDVKTSMDNVVVIPHDGRRKLGEFKETLYIGEKHQRKTNGHCKIYNKQLELLENQNIVIDHELTRIEIVYKPEQRIPLAELLHHPPEQNKQYFAAVITDWDSLPKKRAEQARMLMKKEESKKVSPYIRKMVKETLAPSSQVDLNELAREAWKPLLEELCGLLLGQQEPQVQERPLQMAVTNTVYDEPKKENDRKNENCADYGKHRHHRFEKQSIAIDHEFSCIEIVYNPDKNILLSDVDRYLPERNEKYFAAAVLDWSKLPKKRSGQARNMRDGIDMYIHHIRERVRETLAHPYHVDFNRLAMEQWGQLIEEPSLILLAA